MKQEESVRFAEAFGYKLYQDGLLPPFEEKGIYAAIEAFCGACMENNNRFDEVLFLEKVHEFRNKLIQEDLDNHYREEE